MLEGRVVCYWLTCYVTGAAKSFNLDIEFELDRAFSLDRKSNEKSSRQGYVKDLALGQVCEPVSWKGHCLITSIVGRSDRPIAMASALKDCHVKGLLPQTTS